MRKIRLHFSGAHSISFLCFTRQIPLVTCYCCVGHIKCLFNSKILFVIFNINMILNTYGKPPETNLWYFFKMLFVLCTLSVFSCYSYSNGNYSLMSITCWRFTKGSFEAKLSVFSFFFLFCFLFCFCFCFERDVLTCWPELRVVQSGQGGGLLLSQPHPDLLPDPPRFSARVRGRAVRGNHIGGAGGVGLQGGQKTALRHRYAHHPSGGQTPSPWKVLRKAADRTGRDGRGSWTDRVCWASAAKWRSVTSPDCL